MNTVDAQLFDLPVERDPLEPRHPQIVSYGKIIVMSLLQRYKSNLKAL